jgi:hypothetical protein
MAAMAVAVTCRVSTVGARLDALVLGRIGNEVIGVDLASGAFVRIAGEIDDAVKSYDVVRAEVGGAETMCSPYAPEAVDAAGTVGVVGHMGGRRVERMLRTLTDPVSGQLLGFAGPGRPWWTLEADRPSVALLTPSVGPLITGDGVDFRCRFAWNGRVHELPLLDVSITKALGNHGTWQAGPDDIGRMLGRKANRLVVVLGPPSQGHCYKVVAGILTKP